MKRYRAAIIGCGKIGSEFADDPKMKGDIFTHAEAYDQCPDTTLVAICDTDPQKLARCGLRWNVEKRYADYLKMVGHEHLDIVSVCTPDHTHYQVVKELLMAPHSVKAILCEKPLATTLERAQEMVSLAKQSGVILVIVYMRRFARNFQALKDFLGSKSLGQIQGVSGWYTKGVRHNGTHWFDSLRFLVGEVEWVKAWNQVKDDQVDPTLDIVLGLDHGVLASLRACDARYFTIFEMEILGSLGRIQLLDSGFKIEYSKVIDSKRYTGYRELEAAQASFGDRKNMMLYAVENVVAALKTGKPVACSGEDGVEAIRIADAALQSARLGEAVHLD